MQVSVRRLTAATIGSGAVLGALLLSAGTASADDPAPAPPNCTAADFAGVNSGVSAATSAYLFTHPDVNNFFTSLHGLSRDEITTKVNDYFAAHPQEQAEISSIRQPILDIKNRCGYAAVPVS
ncbi:heme-binding protein [Mycolicibacterium brumae]|uniref:Hemophore-related protein n=1 Tax=Mycolicibacterium brumae TaxID=85968 RepID=A0A2G5PGK8_9MYCO|nr:heme-binding protein [Mycolicibacterium brumae]MCV7194454.1 heme-binding protein [Mycolicibacterium brumae]PIB77163.1 hemophore-related protein [Mycolicibacterium brumae]RWA15395.1 hypothetical protein MBRU_10120 [Mycolicibacterium brumae DSM 44177]UWW10508.1 heme-binding protein [Mycolicibacterium brumae]